MAGFACDRQLNAIRVLTDSPQYCSCCLVTKTGATNNFTLPLACGWLRMIIKALLKRYK